ncbi:MAG TPA: O-acetyl-ADP-ribose deacetylase [Gemmatimonadaceae bacterium]
MIDVLHTDITTLRVDAIVNAANAALSGGGGVDGAIHRAAGPELMRALEPFAGCPTGSAVITNGFRLPARFVIHAVGPIWRGGSHDEPALLASAYETAFRLAREQGSIRSIAFPAISAGVYGYPKPDAARVALRTMLAHEHEFDRIVAVLFDVDHLRIYEETMEWLRGSRL